MPAPTVTFNAPTAYFSGTLVSLGAGTIIVTLVDGVTGVGGDGEFEVVFAQNELSVFGSGTNGPALHCVKGKMPYDPRVFVLGQFSVLNNVVWGYRDRRVMGGISLQNIPAGLLVLGILGDVLITSPQNNQGLVYNSGAAKWENELIVNSLAGLTGVLTLGSSDSSVTITPSGTNIDLKAAGGSGGFTNYDATILAEASLTHFYKMNDASGSTSAADSKGSTNLTVHGTVTFGCRPIARDNEKVAYFDFNTADYLAIPSSILPVSGSWSIEFVFACIGEQNVAGSNNTWIVSLDSSLNLDFYVGTDGALKTYVGGVTQNTGMDVTATQPIHVCAVVNTGLGQTLIYVNGAKIYTVASTPHPAGPGTVGMRANTSNAYQGYVAKLAIYNAALTSAQILAHYVNF